MYIQLDYSLPTMKKALLGVISAKTSLSPLSHAAKFDLPPFFSIYGAIHTLQLSILAYFAVPNCARPETTVVRYLKGDIFFTDLSKSTFFSFFDVLPTRKCSLDMKIVLIFLFLG